MTAAGVEPHLMNRDVLFHGEGEYDPAAARVESQQFGTDESAEGEKGQVDGPLCCHPGVDRRVWLWRPEWEIRSDSMLRRELKLADAKPSMVA